MKRIFSISMTLLICCIVLASATAAFSAEKSGPFNSTTISSITDWTSALVFPKFNTSLGTLVQVDLDVTSTINTILTVTNSAASDSSGNAKTHVVVTVTDPSSLISLTPDIYSSAYYYQLAAGASTISGTLTNSGSDSGSYTSSNILNEFKGPGNISMPTSTFTETVLANTGGNTSASQATSANATGTVTYWYTLAPEPSSIFALLTGLVGGIAVLRPRKK